MPNVNIKYQLTLDAFATLNELKFEGEDFAEQSHTDGTDNLPPGTLTIDNVINIRLLTSGASGTWTIAVWVLKLNDNGQPVGTWKPCANNGLPPFTDDVDVNNLLEGNFSISW